MYGTSTLPRSAERLDDPAYGPGGNVLATDVTDANGEYSFTVDPGTYRICEVINGQAGWSRRTRTPACSGLRTARTCRPTVLTATRGP